MAQRVTSPEFIGRVDELDLLERTLAGVSAGDAAMVLLGGDSGVGKSRLLEEFEKAAAAAGARGLCGECFTLGGGELPYAPISAALRPLALEADAGELVGPWRGELARLLPDLGAVEHGAGVDLAATGEPVARARLFHAVLSLLAAATQRYGPVVLEIEDLHWADRSTLELLSFLVRNVRSEPLMIVATFRSDELHRRHPLLPFLIEEERRPNVQRVQLEPFTPAELGRQLEGILGAAPGAAVVERLFERSEGNAFYTEELIAASPEPGTPLPQSLRDALSARIDALPEQALPAVRVLAVAGRNASHGLLAAAASQDEAELAEALRAAEASQLIVRGRRGDTWSFRHALLQEAVYGDLLPGERTGLHVRLAEALTADSTLADPSGRTAQAELAHHWRAAHRLPQALGSSVAAGEEALEVYAFSEAGHHFETAIELWSEVSDAPGVAGISEQQLVARAAEAFYFGDDYGRAIGLGRRAIELADEAGDVSASSLSRERLGRYLWVAGDSDGALAAYQEAVRLQPADKPTRELALVLASEAQILMLRGEPDAGERCRRAIEIARQVGARDVEGHALNTLGTSYGYFGERRKGQELIREAMRIAREVEHIDEVERCYVNLSDSVDQDGRVAEAVEIALEGSRMAASLGFQTYVQFLRAEAAERLVNLGRLDEAEQLTRESLDLPADGLTAVGLNAASARVALMRGDLDRAEQLVAGARSMFRGRADPMFTGQVVGVAARVALARREPETARELVAIEAARVEGAEYAFYAARPLAAGVEAEADIAERARALGDDAVLAEAVERASQLVAHLSRSADDDEWRGTAPPYVKAQALLGAAELTRARGQAQPDAWTGAAAAFQELDYVLDAAYARMRGAEAAVEAGDRDQASALLASADSAARASGAGLLLDRIESLARRARLQVGDGSATPVPEDDGAPLGLTERELAVLELVAAGNTNREIGERLFISEKTASVHVSRILAKLGVKSRVEAAAVAHRVGITGGDELEAARVERS